MQGASVVLGSVVCLQGSSFSVQVVGVVSVHGAGVVVQGSLVGQIFEIASILKHMAE